MKPSGAPIGASPRAAPASPSEAGSRAFRSAGDVPTRREHYQVGTPCGGFAFSSAEKTDKQPTSMRRFSRSAQPTVHVLRSDCQQISGAAPGHSALSRVSRRHAETSRITLEELSGASELPMIIRMTTTTRPQQRYDHRRQDLVRRTGDLTIATDLGVPRATARGWLGGRADGRAPPGCGGPHGAGTPAGDPRRCGDASSSSRRCSGSRWHCYRPPGFGSQESVCRTPAPRCGSCARGIGLARASRCERSCGSCACRRVGFRPGADGRARVRSTIHRPVPAPHRID
jgi:hypothetical protein